MRLAPILLAFTVLTSPFAYSQTSTPTQQTAPVCDGSYNVIRLSEIKPGMIPKFLEAVAAHQAWYKNAGGPDRIFALRIIDRNPDTKIESISETQVVTSHIEPATRAQSLPTKDDAYNAFVKMYQESSTIKSEFHTCMPKM
ncbi:MAG: hypothetical protein JWQ42_4859 [Edaphobacter sp.]|nr:hypothetical protein [Edaphobacter sp.]